MSELDVLKLAIQSGNRKCEIGDFYKIKIEELFVAQGGRPSPLPPSGERGAREHGHIILTLIGDHSLAINVGAGLGGGSLHVVGDVGPHAGTAMTGGHLVIDGNAGDALGAEMAGGVIQVNGRAGHRIGGALPGSRRGMIGGRIIIFGDAGDEVGHKMRRGVVAVYGRAGDFAGAAMIAGTIYCLGPLGAHAGAGMIRGTIITENDFALTPSFVQSCDYEPSFLKLFNEDLRLRQGKGLQRVESVRCYRGDVLTGGRGEIWRV
jgi:formylmethanofuran dehydrogenase subunit C